MPLRALNRDLTLRIQFCEIWWAEAGLTGSKEDISSALMRKLWLGTATKILVYMTCVFTVNFSAFLFNAPVLYLYQHLLQIS